MKKRLLAVIISFILLSDSFFLLPISAVGLIDGVHNEIAASTVEHSQLFNAKSASENESEIFNYLTGSMGFNTAAACGVIANIYYESYFDPNAVGDSGTSYGICQWHDSRWNNLKNYCNNNGYDWRSLTGQLHFLDYELKYCKGDTGYVINHLSVSNDANGAYDAGYNWCYYFGRPKNKESVSVTRGNRARDIYWPKYNNSYDLDPKYNGLYPIYSYTLTSTEKTIVYSSVNGSAKTNKIYVGDECTIDAIYSNGWCHVVFPLDSGGTDNGYVPLSAFVAGNSWESISVSSQTTTYRRSDASDSYGWIGSGDIVYRTAQSGSMSQILYPLSAGGYKLAWANLPTVNPPDKPTVYLNGSTSHLKIGAGNSITFTFNAPNADSLHLYIYKGSDIYFEGEFAPSASYTRQFYDAAQYSCVIISHNSGGSTYSDWRDWDVAARPGKPTISKWGNSTKDKVYFTWNETEGTTWYDLRIYDSTGTCVKYIPGIYDNCYGVNLSEGSYSAGLCSVLSSHYECWTESDHISFNVSSEPITSPFNAYYYNGHIYEVYNDTLTWEEAEYYCENYRGGHLATITSQEEQDFIQNNLLSDNHHGYLIGGTDKDQEGTWKWVTGEPFGYTNWHSGQPDNYTGNHADGECYLEIYPATDKWNDFYYDSYHRGFICEIETEKFEPINTITYNGHLYELYNCNITYGEAENYCRWNGGHLVCITSAEEQSKVYSLLSKTESSGFCWLGATCINRGENWTGGNDNWKWEDDSVFAYSNWRDNQPDYWQGLETCLMMYKSDGSWNDINWDYPCKNEDTFCFILEKEIPAAVLQSIEISSLPDKTEYNIGDGFDSTGLKLKLTYSDGSNEIITSGYTLSGFDSSSAGAKTITVTYSGFSATLEITVVEQKLIGDVDGDGEVSDWDAILLNRYLAGWKNVTLDLSVADIDGDGEVNDWDAITLERYLAGWKIEINN